MSVFLWLAGMSPALAAEVHTTSEATFLIQITLLIVVGRLLGEVMVRLKQPAVMGQLLAGIILGPSLLGQVFPEMHSRIFSADPTQTSMIGGISAFGVLLLLLLSGMETDLRLVRKVGRPAVLVSIAGIVVPFICGYTLGELLPDALLPDPHQRLATSLFLGTALSISSVKIVAAVVRELGFQRRNIGQIILASAVLDDSIAWILVGIISTLAATQTIDLAGVARSTMGTILFLAISFTIGRKVISRLIRWTNDSFHSEMAVVSLIIVVMMVMALTTDAIGVHSVLGAFTCGILVGNSPLLTRQIDEQLRGLVAGLFMPVFFGLSGLAADISVLANPALLAMTIGIVVIASIGKFGGAFLGGWMSGLSFRESLTLGCGMNARGSTEVIIATIGLSIGVFDETLYTMIVTMAFITTLAMPPLLRWSLSRLPISKDEEERLGREAFEERSFVARLERLLIAVDDSKHGQFASRLAGLLAGARGLTTTVLHLPLGGHDELATAPTKEKLQTAIETVKEAVTTSQAKGKDDLPSAVDLTMRAVDLPTKQAIEQEAQKGYGLLFAGLEGAIAGGVMSDEMNTILEAFHGAAAIAVARGIHAETPLHPRLNILVPITGTEGSRRALETALTLAYASNGRVTALYVSERRESTPRFQLGRTIWTTGKEEKVLRQAVDLADQYGAALRTAAATDIAPQDAILRRVRRARYDLIVMGVRRREGDDPSFGTVAASILEESDRSVLLVAE